MSDLYRCLSMETEAENKLISYLYHWSGSVNSPHFLVSVKLMLCLASSFFLSSPKMRVTRSTPDSQQHSSSVAKADYCGLGFLVLQKVFIKQICQPFCSKYCLLGCTIVKGSSSTPNTTCQNLNQGSLHKLMTATQAHPASYKFSSSEVHVVQFMLQTSQLMKQTKGSLLHLQPMPQRFLKASWLQSTHMMC